MIFLRIAAVLATRNRKEMALGCLQCLAAQSVLPEWVIVIDNASTDGTKEALRNLSDLPFVFERIDAGENLGNAGGIERAMERAFSLGADAVWILDDDSWPEPEALEQLLDPQGPVGVRSSLVLEPEQDTPSWPFQFLDATGNWQLTTEFPQKPGWLRIRRSWLGVLITRKVRETVGRVRGDLFLRGEDEDYPRRIEAAGYEVYLNPRSILRHPPGGKLRTLSLFGKKVVLEAGLSGDKLYYRLRNTWWMTARQRGAFVTALLAICHLILMLRDGSMWSNLHVIAQAAQDALTNRLGVRRKN